MACQSPFVLNQDSPASPLRKLLSLRPHQLQLLPPGLHPLRKHLYGGHWLQHKLRLPGLSLGLHRILQQLDHQPPLDLRGLPCQFQLLPLPGQQRQSVHWLPLGKYLNGTICSNCVAGCASCTTLNQCTYCDAGFVPIQSGTIEGNLMDGLVNCTACFSPCASCRVDKESCTSCVSGFSLASDICLSDFNYKVSVVLQVTLAEFENNFLGFLKKIAVAAGVSVNNHRDQLDHPGLSGRRHVHHLLHPSRFHLSRGQREQPQLSDRQWHNQQHACRLLSSDGPRRLAPTTLVVTPAMEEWSSSNNAGGNTTGRNIELSTNQTKKAYL